MASPLDRTQIDEIVRLRQGGMPARAIAARLHVTKVSVYKYLHRHDAPVRHLTRTPKEVIQELTPKVIEMYPDMPVAQIAAATGLYPRTVTNILVRAGVTIVPPGLRPGSRMVNERPPPVVRIDVAQLASMTAAEVRSVVDKEVVRLYDEDERSIRQIRDALPAPVRLSYGTIQNVLAAAGVKMRPRGGKPGTRWAAPGTTMGRAHQPPSSDEKVRS